MKTAHKEIQTNKGKLPAVPLVPLPFIPSHQGRGRYKRDLRQMRGARSRSGTEAFFSRERIKSWLLQHKRRG